MGEHAKFSPSSLEAVGLCAGRTNAIAALPPELRESKDSMASIQGTRRHVLSEWRVTHRDDPWPTELEGYAITSDDVEAAKLAVEVVLKQPGAQPREGRQMLLEQKVEIGKYCGLEEGLVWGTADVVLLTPTTLTIIDYKFGRYPVEPGLQLKAYAVGAGALVDWGGAHRQLKTVELMIIQPDGPDQMVKRVSFPLEVMKDWAQEIRKIAEAAQAPDAPRTPGDKQCKFCQAAGSCPARTQGAAAAMFDALGPPDKAPDGPPAPIASVDTIVDIAEVKMAQNPEELSDEDLGRILDQAPLIEGWLKDVRKLAHRRLSEGLPVPGYKLIEGRKSRDWKGSEEDVVKMLRGCGLKLTDIFTKKLITAAQSEKVAALNKSKVYKQRVADAWEWKKGKPQMAPESDPAPALGESMFDKVPQETSPVDDTPSWM